MTPQEIANEIEWIKDTNKKLIDDISCSTDKQTKEECRAKLRENNHQLMHLESVLISIRYDPFM